jgi:hypothetical protein
MLIVPVHKNAKNGFTVARVHYSLDPLKNTPAWVAMAKQGMTERAWNREYELDYTIFAGKTFFPEFKEYNIADCIYQERETLYRSFDYGFHRPACLITKLNQFDQWCWLECILGEDEGIMKFGRRVFEHCVTHYPGAYWFDAGDPAGEQKSDKSEKTSVQVLNSLGIYPRSQKQPIKQGAEIIRQKLAIRADGRAGLIVHPSQTILIDGFKGGLHYPEIEGAQTEKEYYEKDGFYEHPFDAARYIATEMFTVIGQTQMANPITRSGDGRDEYAMGTPEREDRGTEAAGQISADIMHDNTQLEDFF